MKRETYFVCSGIINNVVLADEIKSDAASLAKKIFIEKHNIAPSSIHGPFYKRKKHFKPFYGDIVVTNKYISTTYCDWIVKAFILKEPHNHALLLFIKNKFNDDIVKPKGNIVISLDELEINL